MTFKNFEDKRALNFQQQLENSTGTKLHLKINDNHSTMLSVKWEPDCTKVSLHRMFLQAPQNIMQALACYLKGEDRKLSPSIRAYIDHHLKRLDYSHKLDLSQLSMRGKVFDLEKIYLGLNREYFESPLGLRITWFGEGRRRLRKKVTFGLYHDPLRLIKINRLLDDHYFPNFFVSYVIYHEMLHFVCPASFDLNGHKAIHSKEFKRRESEFKHFKQAQQWIRDNQSYIFSHY